MKTATLANVEVSLTWRSAVASHCDRLFVSNIDTAHDSVPAPLSQKLLDLKAGEICDAQFAAGELVPAHDPLRQVTFPRTQFISQQRHLRIEPRLGRFYPQGFAWQALNCTPNTFQPFRIINDTPLTLAGDLNHPLAQYPLTLHLRDASELVSQPQRANTPRDIARLITENGAGMQTPYPKVSTDFYADYPFGRGDEAQDAQFYTNPRLIRHLDSTAIAQVTALYARLLTPNTRVLDLMSSWVSHLPESLTLKTVTGLGMNTAELAANPRLTKRVVHDLNHQPQLPFADDQFDAVICSVSVEYLTQPLAVMEELARVTQAGGKVTMVFSTRWFPSKAISLWGEMHPFERQGLVLDYFLKTGKFSELHTESLRGLPRPKTDPHYRETSVSDPVFAVWGTVKSTKSA